MATLSFTVIILDQLIVGWSAALCHGCFWRICDDWAALWGDTCLTANVLARGAGTAGPRYWTHCTCARDPLHCEWGLRSIQHSASVCVSKNKLFQLYCFSFCWIGRKLKSSQLNVQLFLVTSPTSHRRNMFLATSELFWSICRRWVTSLSKSLCPLIGLASSFWALLVLRVSFQDKNVVWKESPQQCAPPTTHLKR